MNVDFATIHWFHTENTRKDTFGNPLADISFDLKSHKEGTIKGKSLDGEPLVQLLYDGWDMRQAVTVMTVENYATLRKLDVKEVLTLVSKEREAQIEQWMANPDTVLVGHAMRAYWSKTVKYIGNECYRRSVGVCGAIAKRTTDSGAPERFEINVSPRMFASELERLVSHAQENTGKDSGRSRYSALDYLLLAQRVRANGGIEADLIRAMGGTTRETANKVRGNAQKCYRFACLDYQLPSLRLIERAMLPENEANYFPFSAADKEDLAKLVDGYPVTATEKRTTARQVDPVAVEDYVVSLRGGRGKPQKMSASQIDTSLCKARSIIMQVIGRAILGNSPLALSELDRHSEELNKLAQTIGLAPMEPVAEPVH